MSNPSVTVRTGGGRARGGFSVQQQQQEENDVSDLTSKFLQPSVAEAPTKLSSKRFKHEWKSEKVPVQQRLSKDSLTSTLFQFLRYIKGLTGLKYEELIDEDTLVDGNLTFLNVSAVVQTNISTAAVDLAQICDFLKVKPEISYDDIIQDCSHPCYTEFYSLVAAYMNLQSSYSTAAYQPGRSHMRKDIAVLGAKIKLRDQVKRVYRPGRC
jgi:hypothetical protein